MKLVALSDQHGFLPKTPEGDLLVVAGDLCKDQFNNHWASSSPTGLTLQRSWLENTWVRWAEEQPQDFMVATYGNHDFCGNIYQHHPPDIHTDEEVVIDGLRIWLSPWSPTFMDWAWMASEDELAKKYALIPDGIDVLVSHCPPKGCGDLCYNPQTQEYEPVGSAALVNAIKRVKPQVVICGHIHSGRGLHDLDGIPVWNVSVVNEGYQLVHEPVVIEVEPR